MITRIEADGYRLLDGFAADFMPLTVVIGANAVGKSTLLDCLQLIAQCVEFPVNTAIGWHWGPASLLTAGRRDGKLAWKVSIQKPSAAFWNQVPLEEGQPLVYEVTLQADPQGQVRPQYEVLRNPQPAPGYLATALLNPAAPPLIAVDEPELGLHPRLLPIVGDLIKSAAERTQVLVTTHSPDLLNRFDIGDIAVMARASDAPRVVWHRPADRDTLVKMLKAVSGETLGDLHRSGELEAGA